MSTTDSCPCCEGRGWHSTHFNPGGWRRRPCVLCDSTGIAEGSPANRPGDDHELLVMRRRCCKLHFGIKDEPPDGGETR